MTHFIIDAMNVIGSRPDGWWRDRDGAVLRLARWLAVAREGSITLVIDGRPIGDLPAGVTSGIEIVYAGRPGPNAADDRIIDCLRAADDAAACVVVTSDRALAARARACGASVRGARSLLADLAGIADGG